MVTRNQIKVGDILQLDNSPISVKIITKLEKDKLFCTRYWWDGDTKDNDYIFYSSLEFNNYNILSKEEFIEFASSLIESKRQEYETYKNGISRWMEVVSKKLE